MNDELLDIVDDNDNVIGCLSRSSVYSQGLNNFRVINCFLENSKGELWIPRRSPEKKLFPLCLDVSAGGHVKSGESYREALHRELREELRIDSSRISIDILGYLHPIKHGVSAFMTVFRIKTDNAPEYNPRDFVSAEWILPDMLVAKINSGEPAKDDLIKLVKIFYS